MFPSARRFHDGSDPRRERYLDDEFAGIDSFPFTSVETSLPAAHDRLIDGTCERIPPTGHEIQA